MSYDPKWPHGPQPTRAPMTLGARSCPGKQRSAINPTAVGICYGCTLYGAQHPEQIKPAAQVLADGTWFCNERRSLGVVHAESVGASAAADESANRGGVGTDSTPTGGEYVPTREDVPVLGLGS